MSEPKEQVETTEEVIAVEEVVESTEVLEPKEVESEELTIDDTDRILEVNSRLENYETVLTKFTDILTLTENNLMKTGEDGKPRSIITLGLELYTAGANYCETGTEEDLYKFLAKNFEYIGMYLYTFSSEETIMGILTSKINNLLYDYIGNQEDLLTQFNIFQANFKGDDNDIKTIVTPLIFNLSNLGTTIGCLKTITHYIKLKNELPYETILENIILHIEK